MNNFSQKRGSETPFLAGSAGHYFSSWVRMFSPGQSFFPLEVRFDVSRIIDKILRKCKNYFNIVELRFDTKE